jgi:hypothetical protein
MKKKFVLMMAAAAIVVAGCSKDEGKEPVKDEEPVVAALVVTPLSISAPVDGGSQPVAVTSNVAWTANVNSAATWVSLTPASGAGNGTVMVDIAANPLTVARAATITVAAGTLTRAVAVTQGAEDLTFANFNPDPSAAAGSTWTLRDERDNKLYVVKLMSDNRYWMVQNLAFGDCTESSFYNDNSAEATTHAPTVAAGYVGHCRTNPREGAGYLYNWPAAMQNENAYYGSSDNSFACSGSGPGTVSPNPASC